MKLLAIAALALSLQTFACPNVNLTNLQCNDSDFGPYTMSSLLITSNYVKAVVDGEIIESSIPYSDGDIEVKCSGNKLITIEKAAGLTTETVMTVSGNTITRTGSRFVWQCDSEQECNNDQYYLAGTESFTDTCTAN